MSSPRYPDSTHQFWPRVRYVTISWDLAWITASGGPDDALRSRIVSAARPSGDLNRIELLSDDASTRFQPEGTKSEVAAEHSDGSKRARNTPQASGTVVNGRAEIILLQQAGYLVVPDVFIWAAPIAKGGSIHAAACLLPAVTSLVTTSSRAGAFPDGR